MMRLAAVGVSGLALLATAVVPASAATLSVSDPRDDAAAAVDITRLTVVNGTSTVTVRARVPELKPGRVGQSIVALRVREPGTAAANYVVITRRTASGVTTTLWKAPFASERPEDPTPCPGLSVRWVRDSRVVAQVPATCLETNRRMQAGVYLERRDATALRHADWAPGRFAVLSPWVPRG
jgi:hypothetical protein